MPWWTSFIFLNNDDVLHSFSLPKGSMQLVDADNSTYRWKRQPRHCKKHMASGGSAANTIHGLARLGVDHRLYRNGGTGSSLGTFFEKDMIRAGITPLLSQSTSRHGQCQFTGFTGR